ncbi:hypothetical protein VNO77_04645 [Canavalia gladiata]|uniref:Uncharacterized protein n=1 Tax=Canavalia gladiata TaxID=3824 RepID=A0AAN9N2J3_CANGL
MVRESIGYATLAYPDPSIWPLESRDEKHGKKENRVAQPLIVKVGDLLTLCDSFGLVDTFQGQGFIGVILSSGGLPITKDIQILELDIEEIPTKEDICQARRGKLSELVETLQQKEFFLHQKSGITWLQAGDENTTYFHRSVTEKQHMNQLATLQGENGD